MHGRAPGRPQRDPPPAVPGYNLECPRQEELLRSLRQVSPEEAEEIWREACARVGLSDEEVLGAEELQRVAEQIETRDDTVGVVAGAFAIRLRSYLLLARIAQARG